MEGYKSTRGTYIRVESHTTSLIFSDSQVDADHFVNYNIVQKKGTRDALDVFLEKIEFFQGEESSLHLAVMVGDADGG